MVALRSVITRCLCLLGVMAVLGLTWWAFRSDVEGGPSDENVAECQEAIVEGTDSDPDFIAVDKFLSNKFEPNLGLVNLCSNLPKPWSSFILAHPELYPIWRETRDPESPELKALLEEMAALYEARRFRQMAQLGPKIHEMLKEGYVSRFAVYNKAFNKAYSLEKGRFLCHDLRRFSDAGELEAYLRTNMEAVRFMAGARIALRQVMDHSDFLECEDIIRRMLRRYEALYIQEHNDALLSVVTACLKEWQRQIESEEGYMRLWVRLWLKKRDWICRKRGMTVEEAVRDIRYLVDTLFKPEASPSWLDLEIEKVFGKMGGGEKGESR